MAEILRVEHLTKVYRNHRGMNRGVPLVAVDDVSFTVNSGEVVGFLGPNGAGKSTTIKMIVGLAVPTSGDVFICGHDVKTEREKAMAHVGGVIESPDMYKEMTALENLKYFATLEPLPEGDAEAALMSKKDYDAKRVQAVLELVGLADRARDRVKTYSMGMKQRLGIAQALLGKPKLLILDEPANGLDPTGIKEIRDMLRRLAADYDMAVLVSSHQLAEMQLMCDRVMIISGGKLTAEKKIDELNVDNEGAVGVVIKVDKPTEAAALIKEKFGLDADIFENSVKIHTKLSTSELTRELVLAGFNVYGVSEEAVKLEDVFMSATRRDGNV